VIKFCSVFLIGFTVYSAFPSSTAATQARGGYLNGFPNDPSFFPIGVWLRSPERAPAYKAIGINTFIGLWEGPTEDQLAALTKFDMFVVASQNEVGLHSTNRGIIKGWLMMMSRITPNLSVLAFTEVVFPQVRLFAERKK
jgi:hypothetical protein